MQDGATSAITAPARLSRETGNATHGFVYALMAYLAWGCLPLYMKAVAHIPPVEVVAHRIMWSVPVAGLVLVIMGRTSDIKAALRSPRTLAMAALTAAIISLNWGIYVWAIAADRTVEAALGYYINPLVTVILGVIFLGERIDRVQLVAVGLAIAAVIILTVEAGDLPWVPLALAFSFGAYGYLRKTLPIGPSQGFFLEVLLLTPLCLAYIIWAEVDGQGHLFSGNWRDVALLLASGPITAIPLILYGLSTRMLRITTLGLMHYITPTIAVVIAVFVFMEPFGPERMIAFGLIWVALALYTWALLFRKKAS